jgi:hypothetical protein
MIVVDEEQDAARYAQATVEAGIVRFNRHGEAR